jgi:hypothetical protein
MFIEGGRCLRAQGPWARYGAGDRSSRIVPSNPEVGNGRTGNAGYPPSINKVNELRIVVLIINAYDHQLYGVAVGNGGLGKNSTEKRAQCDRPREYCRWLSFLQRTAQPFPVSPNNVK